MRPLATDEFIEQSIKLHGDKFDYSRVKYLSNKKPVEIGCKIHKNYYFQRPSNHLNGKGGCKICQKENSLKPKNKFIKKAQALHGDKYDYSLVDYKGAYKKIKIICPVHGLFEQPAKDHTRFGCYKCGREQKANSNKINTEDYLKRVNEIHKNKYDYPNLEIYDLKSQFVYPICPKHNTFKQKATNHLYGNGCQKCARDRVNKAAKKGAGAWSKEKWKERAENSKNYTGYKLYIIKCWNEEEEFYKVGRTFKEVESRSRKIPYETNLCNVEISDSCNFIFYIEKDILKNYKSYKYKPKKYFAGYTECFTTDLPIEEVKEYISKTLTSF